MNNREKIPGIMRSIIITLLGGVMLSFGGIVLAATAPVVTKITFKDTMATPDVTDDVELKMTTGYVGYRVALDAKGNAYVTDPEINAIKRYNTNAHLLNTYRINLPRGIAVSGDGDLYVSGVLNGYNKIFVLDQAGGVSVKGVLGGPARPVVDIAVDSQGSLVTVDEGGNVINIFDKNGVSLKTFGPFVERLDGPDLIGSTNYYRTRHTLTSASGLTLDANGDIYVTMAEYVDYLGKTCVSGNCTSDPNSWSYYQNTDSTYTYWNIVESCSTSGSCTAGGLRYIVVVVDRNSGSIKRRMPLTPYSADDTLMPRGLALDDSGRLYVATSQGIKVYDAATGVALSTIGVGTFMDISYDTVKKWIYASTGSEVVVYGIDGYKTSTNTAPTAPTVLEPTNGSYAPSTTPTLLVNNATDGEQDPLTYRYQVVDSGNNVIASSSLVSEGANGRASAATATPLTENALYSWRARSFDGNAYSCWSDERWDDKDNVCVKDQGLKVEFCVNERNDNPEIPIVIGPKDAQASPFGSVLSWNASKDPDCYDTVSYVVEVSMRPDFSSSRSIGASATSIKLGDLAKDLVNGGTYYWRVKAVDNNKGESAYSNGSFIYKTTIVNFTSDQPNTKVYIDGNYGYLGRYLGVAPVEVQNIAPGKHFVTFLKAGYEPYHTIINVADPFESSGSTAEAVLVKAAKIRLQSEGSELVSISEGYASPFVVDYNNDGLKDVVVGGGDGNVYLYVAEEQLQGDGTKKIVLVSRGAVANVGSMAVPFVADYNNDGKKDLLVGSGEGLIYLYLNSGADDAPLFNPAGTLKDNSGDIKVANSAPAIVDYNNDGRKDLVVGSSEGNIRLYTNTGTDESPEFAGFATIKDINFAPNANTKAFFTDWNSDGKKDLVVGAGALHLFLNVGTDESPDFRSISDLQNWIKEKKRERGNREFIPYLGYTQDLGDLTGGNGEGSPFVVDWEGTSARDIIVGNGRGGVQVFTAE